MTAVLLPGGCVDTHLHPMQLENVEKYLKTKDGKDGQSSHLNPGFHKVPYLSQ